MTFTMHYPFPLPVAPQPRAYVLPAGIDTTRTFDDPRVAVEAHHQMNVRFDNDARSTDQYEG